jgi:regulator of protease activity HflC (stomatin/prohibitin superfamily)
MPLDVNFAFLIIVGVFALYILSRTVWIFREYERGVVFTLGRYTKTIGPGLTFVIPLVQQIVRVDLRMKVENVPPQDVISRDNVSAKVSAVFFFRVVDAERATINIQDYMMATSQLAQTTLRSVLGKHELDEILAERDKLNTDIQTILDQHTDSWGIKVANVEIKDVDIAPSMVTAIARQAEAERFRRAKIINAEGEQQAAQKLIEAGKILAEQPNAMLLRYFGALHDIAGNRTSTIVFPLPMDLISMLKS